MHDEAAKISVIIPVYKVEKYLDRCIESVVNQTYTNLEIILVDDGSPDRCGEICDKWSEKDDRIRVIHQPNGGLSDARNVGLDIATGKYIAFVDSDDFINQDMLDTLYVKIHEEIVDLVVCGFEYDDEDGRYIGSWHPEKESIINSETALLMLADEQSISPNVWNKIYPRYLWDGIRFPKGKLYEDAFVMHKILWQCRQISLIHDALYHYVQRDDSITRKKATIHSWDNIEEMYERILFYEQHGLKWILLNTKSPILDRFFRIRKDILIQSKEEKQRYIEAKQMVRYYIKNYGKNIRIAEIFSFEMPRLFRFFQQVRDRMFRR